MDPGVVQNLVQQIERKDLSTAAHTWRVVLYTRAMAESLSIDHEQIALITQAAALHDIGKLDLPDHILQKPGKLTDEEFEIIKYHPVSGSARMIDLDVTEEPILDLVRYHHERWDGVGYPFQLKAEDIPIGARLFAVIDSFDAMTSVRPYREVLGDKAAELALIELQAGMGSQYWPDAVEAFTELFKSGGLDHILHYFNDEVTLPAFEHARHVQFDAIRNRYSKL
ncbi:MAG: HD-GYP domain-containing protein [Phycisphaerales bacterium]|nr:HD-GYP domain-containing protein [Phycisphaerales bacterium]